MQSLLSILIPLSSMFFYSILSDCVSKSIDDFVRYLAKPPGACCMSTLTGWSIGRLYELSISR